MMISLVASHVCCNVWNVCETQSSKEAGKSALGGKKIIFVKDGENRAAFKQNSGDGHQWQQLGVQNTRVHFAEYFIVTLKLSHIQQWNQCVHLKVSYVGGSSWYVIA